MQLKTISCMTSALACTLAAVLFTTPRPGTDVTLNTGADQSWCYIETTWLHDNYPPAMHELTDYCVYLMVGGNLASESYQVSIDDPPKAFGTSGNGSSIIRLYADATESLENVFFVKMVALADYGPKFTVNSIFYSDRWTVTGLTGSIPWRYRQYALLVDGTDGPEMFYNLTKVESDGIEAVSGSSTSAASATSTRPSSTEATMEIAGSRISGEGRVGIVVGTAIGAILIIVIIVLAYLLWRKKQHKPKADLQPTHAAAEKAELQGDGKERSELEQVDHLREVDEARKMTDSAGQASAAELPTDWTGWEAPALLETDLSRPLTLSVPPTSGQSDTIVSPL